MSTAAPTSEHVGTEQPSTGHASTGQPDAAQPSTEHISTEQPRTEQPSTGHASTGRSGSGHDGADRAQATSWAARRRPSAHHADATAIYALASVLLGYPDAALVAARDDLARAVGALAPSPAARHLAAFTDHLTSTDPAGLAPAYVDTFDLRRRTTLNVTYFTYGDTRLRGAALLELKQRFRLAGLTPDPAELPDHLPLLLELAAVRPDEGQAALASCHVGIEALARALEGRRSVYAHVVRAVTLMLGDLSEHGLRRLRALLASGPPREDVGAGPTDLPMPGLPMPDLPAPGIPAPGSATPGLPVPEVPASGLPMPDLLSDPTEVPR